MGQLKAAWLASLMIALPGLAVAAPDVAPPKPPLTTQPTLGTWRSPLPYHGLTALAARNAWRPLERFKRGDAYLSERVIYTDNATGHEVWQMTVDPGVDRVAYYDLPEWNADGSLLMFVSWRGIQPFWMMNADGTRLRPMPIGPREGSSEVNGFWSVREPEIWWAGESDDDGSRVIACNIRTGARQIVAQTLRPRLSLYPPHPGEQYFLLARTGKREQDCEAIVLGRDGSEQVVPIGGTWHRLRFTKADNLQIFFNRDEPRTQWVIMPDGSGRKQLPDAGVHPDWTPDGTELTYFTAGGVFAVTPDGQRRRLFKTGSGGHGGPSLDERFFIADQGASGRFPNSIVCARMDGSEEVWPVAYHGDVMWEHNAASRAHPDHHSTHPHPSFSPDGTKAVFSSYLGRAFVDLHVVICHDPDPPRNLIVRREGRRAHLSWESPEQHRELKGYAVFRSPTNILAYRQMNSELITTREFVDTTPSDEPADYAVAAVEHSGLTSSPARVTSAALAELPASIRGLRPHLETDAPLPPAQLVARPVDAFHAELSWTPSPEPAVQFYHVYDVSEPGESVSQSTRIASPAEPLFMDWGGSPGAERRYCVTAVDCFGHESAPSSTSMTFPKLDIVTIDLLPRDAKRGAGIELGQTTADVGPVARVSENCKQEDRVLAWRLDIPSTGEYAVWSQHRISNEKVDREASLAFDGDAPQRWQMFGTFSAFAWWPISQNPTSTPRLYYLKAGSTRVRLTLGGPGTEFDRLLITNDATRMPQTFAGEPASRSGQERSNPVRSAPSPHQRRN